MSSQEPYAERRRKHHAVLKAQSHSKKGRDYHAEMERVWHVYLYGSRGLKKAA